MTKKVIKLAEEALEAKNTSKAAVV
jgi:hypothetical protein